MSGPMSTLEQKLGKWLAQQNEYPLLFLADRKTRRRAARMVARRVFMLPTVPVQSYVDQRGEPQRIPNRRERRDLRRSVGRQMGRQLTKVSARQERLRLQQERVARRYARLSERRRNELEARNEEVST